MEMSVLRHRTISKSITKNFVVSPGMTLSRTSSLYALRVTIVCTEADATKLCCRVEASTAGSTTISDSRTISLNTA